MARKGVIVLAGVIIGIIWAAFIFEAASARIRVGSWEPWKEKYGAIGIHMWQLACMEANEKLTAAIIPVAGAPIYRGINGSAKEELIKRIKDEEDLEASIKEMEAHVETLARQNQIVRARLLLWSQTEILELQQAQDHGGSVEAASRFPSLSHHYTESEIESLEQSGNDDDAAVGRALRRMAQ